jgi:multiple sugar transport system permease protein
MTTDQGVAVQTIRFALLGAILTIMLFPFLIMFSTAITPTNDLYQFPPPWFPAHPRWTNFLDVWSYVPLAHYFVNSFVIAIGAMIVNGVAAIPAAYAVARFSFPGRRFFLHAIVATQMFSPVVLLIAAFRMMTQLHLLDTYWGLIFINAATSLPFALWMMTSYFATVPREVQEAAVLDRAGPLRILWDHFIPIAMPGIATTMIFTFILAWNEFLFALTFISDPSLRPLTVGIYAFVGRYQIQWNYLMAASLLATIPVLVLFLLIQRRLVAGLTVGAVK